MTHPVHRGGGSLNKLEAEKLSHSEHSVFSFQAQENTVTSCWFRFTCSRILQLLCNSNYKVQITQINKTAQWGPTFIHLPWTNNITIQTNGSSKIVENTTTSSLEMLRFRFDNHPTLLSCPFLYSAKALNPRLM